MSFSVRNVFLGNPNASLWALSGPSGTSPSGRSSRLPAAFLQEIRKKNVGGKALARAESFYLVIRSIQKPPWMSDAFLFSIALHESGFAPRDTRRRRRPHETRVDYERALQRAPAGVTQIRPYILLDEMADAVRGRGPAGRLVRKSKVALAQLRLLLTSLGFSSEQLQGIGERGKGDTVAKELREKWRVVVDKLNTDVRFQALATVFLLRVQHETAMGRGHVGPHTSLDRRRAVVECYYNAGIRHCGTNGRTATSAAKRAFQRKVLGDAMALETHR